MFSIQQPELPGSSQQGLPPQLYLLLGLLFSAPLATSSGLAIGLYWTGAPQRGKPLYRYRCLVGLAGSHPTRHVLVTWIRGPGMGQTPALAVVPPIAPQGSEPRPFQDSDKLLCQAMVFGGEGVETDPRRHEGAAEGIQGLRRAPWAGRERRRGDAPRFRVFAGPPAGSSVSRALRLRLAELPCSLPCD